MKECKLIFAQKDSRGHIRTDMKIHVGDMLVELFGGYTVLEGFGACTMKDGSTCQEPVFVFMFAAEKIDNEGFMGLSLLVIALKKEMGQESVYYRGMNGKVVFI